MLSIPIARRHACALRTDRTVACWGNWPDQGNVTDVPDGEFLSVVTGRRHSCGLKPDQTIVCWGDQDDPERVGAARVRSYGLADAPDGPFRAVAVTYWRSCALRHDNTYTCWGSDTPVGAEESTGVEPEPPGSTATQGLPFSDVSSDAFYSDAVDALTESGLFDGTECAEGMLCPGEAIDRKTMAVWTVRAVDGRDPAAVSVSRFPDVDPGSFHASFVERMAELGVTLGCGDGTNFCPDDTVTRSYMAVFLTRAFKLSAGPNPGFSDVAQNAWNYDHIAALAASGITAGCGDGTAFCPNRSTTRAQMAVFLARATGAVDLPERAEPTTTSEISGNLISISATHGCAVRTDHTITCWGDNTHSQATPPTGEFAAVAVGSSYSCALRVDSTIACWGDNTDGRTDAPDGTYADLAAGPVHPCALHTDGTIRCWGRSGILYPTDSGYQSTDRPPSGTFTDISLSGHLGCAVRTDQSIGCWGHVSRLGATPTGSFVAVDIQHRHACSLRSDHTITCWGFNDVGQSNAPDGTYLSVVTGQRHTCALRPDQTIVCWGDQEDPQRVGAGNVRSYGLTDAPDGASRAIAATNWQTCALRYDNTHTCWGSDTPVEDTAVEPEEDSLVEVIVSPGSSTITEGGTSSYSIVLSAEPSAPIVITVDVPAGSGVSVDTATLTFDPTDWSVPQIIIVTVGHDDNNDDESVRITHNVINPVPLYSTLSIPPHIVAINDDDDSPVGAVEPPGRVQDVQVEWNETDWIMRVSWTAPSDGGPVYGYAIDRVRPGSSFPDIRGRTGAEYVSRYLRRYDLTYFELLWDTLQQESSGSFSYTLVNNAPQIVDNKVQYYGNIYSIFETDKVRIVAYNDSGFSVSASVAIPTRKAQIHRTLQRNIETMISEHGQRVLWLREVGRYISEVATRPSAGAEFEIQGFIYRGPTSNLWHPGGGAFLSIGPYQCHPIGHTDPICGNEGEGISVAAYEGGPTFDFVAPHELAHIYTLSNDASSNPRAITAGHLYLSNRLMSTRSWVPGSFDNNDHPCDVAELYADTAADMVYELIWPGARGKSKWRTCNVEGSANNWQDHIAIIRETLNGTVPDWFYQTYRQDGVTWNLDRLWTDITGITSFSVFGDSQRFVIYDLRNEFGGYCTDQYRELWTYDGNPWRDGGCAKSNQPNELVSVTLAVGSSAQGRPGCSSEHCRYLSVDLEAPTGVYDVECWSGGSSQPWFSGQWHWPASPLWEEGGCWHGHPGGDAVWVTVSPADSNRKLKSNEVTWGQETQPATQYKAVSRRRQPVMRDQDRRNHRLLGRYPHTRRGQTPIGGRSTNRGLRIHRLRRGGLFVRDQNRQDP